MEQDENVYLYRMGNEIYRFEAHNDVEAERVREYALLHFRDKLGTEFSAESLQGPQRVVLRAPHGSPDVKSNDVRGIGGIRMELEDVAPASTAD